jgi:uncharacterized protein
MSDQSHPTFANGKICYVELPAKDVSESSFFYDKVFGWKIRTRGDGSVAFDDAVNEVSGTWRTDRKASTELGTLVHIMVSDIEVTIKAILENGGKIVQPVGAKLPRLRRDSETLPAMSSVYISSSCRVHGFVRNSGRAPKILGAPPYLPTRINAKIINSRTTKPAIRPSQRKLGRCGRITGGRAVRASRTITSVLRATRNSLTGRQSSKPGRQ